MMATNGNSNDKDLEAILLQATSLLKKRKDKEQDLHPNERDAAISVYKELQRILTLATKTNDTFGRPQLHTTIVVPTANDHSDSDFHERFVKLKNQEIEHLVKPLTRENLVQQFVAQRDFFILDNSLRETTVGSVRGHTLAEKHKIVDVLAAAKGLPTEIILGAFGSKISVDSQIASRWKALGESFDNTWGFSDAYDLDGFDEEPLWQSTEDFLQAKRAGKTPPSFWTPTQTVKTTYSQDDYVLFARAYRQFPKPNIFSGKTPQQVLQESQHSKGRIPMGLLMMAGYGICNAIIEVDTAVETFDYQTYNLIDRCRFLMNWCKKHLPPRRGRDNINNNGNNDNHQDQASPRIFMNCRDFVNYHRSESGLEQCLYLVDQLCRLAPNERPFGFLMEDPTGWLWPDEVAKLCQMIRITMNRAGFPQGKFLVHLHMYFGLAEACVLAALCNGANGVWAALCKTGAQVGHACSTITAVNLYRAGIKDIASKYNLSKMRQAARQITSIVMKGEDCPEYEEVYGIHAFDAAFFMWNVPSCRYALAEIMEVLGVDKRFIRLNEISLVSAIHRSMMYHFGEPEVSGWDPKHCKQMWNAIVNHLVTGISRDYNTPLGLGKLYGLVSQKPLPQQMVKIMLDSSRVSDSHPTVIEYVHRWNRLCTKFQSSKNKNKKEQVPPSYICTSKSIMLPCLDVTLQPILQELPLDFYLQDFAKNPVLSIVPWHIRKRGMEINRIVDYYKKYQQITNGGVPKFNFEERLLSLKLFIQEAPSMGLLPLVDDFELRMHSDFFFGEGDAWLEEITGERPKNVTRRRVRMALEVMKKGGNHSFIRALNVAINRIEANAGIRDDINKSLQDVVDFKALQKVSTMDDSEGRDEILDELVNYFDAAVSGSMGFEDVADDDGKPSDLEEEEILPFGTSTYMTKKANLKRNKALKALKKLVMSGGGGKQGAAAAAAKKKVKTYPTTSSRDEDEAMREKSTTSKSPATTPWEARVTTATAPFTSEDLSDETKSNEDDSETEIYV